MIFNSVLLSFGDIRFEIHSERQITLEDYLLDFVIEGSESDVKVWIDWDWDTARKPQTEIKGEDLLGHYYAEQDGTRFLMTKGGYKGYIACTRYDSSCRELYCTINAAPFLEPPSTMGNIMRFLPVREVFLHHQVLFFHAAQVSYGNMGILFTAPSGTGKTTQARLWRDCKGAEIICNDRTLLRKTEGGWYTYGYPLDGSEPIRSTAVNELGAIVVLQQGKECRLQRLTGAKAVSMLMGQLVMDTWSTETKVKTTEFLLELLKDKPIYLFACTPDDTAVHVLEERLKMEGIL